MDYSIFPYWLGINSFDDLIGVIICCVLLFFIYEAIGFMICPNSIEKQWIRAIFILFWPCVIVITFICIPFISVYEFSKPPKVQEEELKKWIRENK